MTNFPLTRRLMLAGVGATATLGGCATRSSDQAGQGPFATAPLNPIVQQRADAQVFRHTDGAYYLTGSVPEYDRLIIRRSPTLAGFTTAEEAVIWRRPTTGKMGGHIWAPELHMIDGRWHMYFAAGDTGQRFRIRTYVLRCEGPDALKDSWTLLGEVQTSWDSFNLDSTTFVHGGQRYLCWAQKDPQIDTNSNLYLAPLATPIALAAPPICLTVPTLPWEMSGRLKVAEAPALLARNGRLFLVYSANATNHLYCLGMLTADAGADIMKLESWTKSPEPVFVSSEETRVWGPGHNSFTLDEQGRDVMVYHGRDYKEITGESLYDPNRHTRVQRIYYRADGAPDFGIPVGNGEVPDRFSPMDQPGSFLRLEGGRVAVGAGAVPATQFRQKPGLAGPGTVSLEPILAPGQVLRRTASGDVVVGPREDGAVFATEASFLRISGLAGRNGVSFAAVGATNLHLQHVSGTLRAAPVGNRAAATFLVT